MYIKASVRFFCRNCLHFYSGRLHDDSVKAFDSSLITCWKALNDLDEESLQEFSAVGSNIQEVKEQLDEIQVSE